MCMEVFRIIDQIVNPDLRVSRRYTWLMVYCPLRRHFRNDAEWCRYVLKLTSHHGGGGQKEDHGANRSLLVYRAHAVSSAKGLHL